MVNNVIVDGIENFIKNNGGKYSDYTVGIAADVDARLRQHSANIRIINKKSWVASSEQDARDTEAYILKIHEYIRGDVGGGTTPNHVYIFKS